MAEKDPSNAQAQRDLSISFNKLGDHLVREGELPQARKLFEDCLRIRKTLAEKDPSNAEAQRDLAWSHWKLFRSGELDDPKAENHFAGYVAVVDDMAEKVIRSWREGDLPLALSRTMQLCGAPMYTGGVLNAFLWGLAREQYHGLRELFEERYPRLKEELRPVYFALLKLMKDEDPDSHRRMGKELEEPVRDILARVEAMRKELNGGPKAKPTNTKAKVSRRPKKRVK